MGDCARVVDAKSGGPCPPTAQHATREAKCVAQNIAAAIRGGSKRAFSFTALGKMGSLGHHSAVAEIFGLKLSGFLAWWLWRTIYLMKLPRLDRKVRVATDWTLDLILPPDITQLKTEHPEGIRRAHFDVLAVDRDAFQALFSHLPPLRGFFEQLIAARLRGPGDPMA